MSNKCEEKIDLILNELKDIKEDVADLKKFKNRVLGGLAVFVFIVQSFASYIFGCYK